MFPYAGRERTYRIEIAEILTGLQLLGDHVFQSPKLPISSVANSSSSKSPPDKAWDHGEAFWVKCNNFLFQFQADVAGACSCGILRQTLTPDLFTLLSNNNISRYVILRCAAQSVIR
ncbi:hypothetical protein C5167_048065 [Papaver somniferum]|uniref:Uncharacterized protein n=1 Tax=Papaver somniferum TaxID=3469 RepID=A0A4Y7KI93_PAPSO|nr:hypothetical protein C5167_048065 [Papaver somniferum]